MINTPHKQINNLILGIFIIVLLLSGTACQKTPDDLIVQNKADDDLAEAIAVTAEPVTSDPEAIEEVDVNADLPNETYRLTERVSNDAGTIVLDIDADVVPIGISKIPVAVVESYSISEKEADAFVNAYFGDAKYSDPYIRTKSDIEAAIIQVKKSATNMESDMAIVSGATTLEELQAEADKQIAKLEKLWEDAPEERPEMTDFEITSRSDPSYNVDIGKGYKGHLDYMKATKYSAYSHLKCSTFRYEMYRTNKRSLKAYAVSDIEDLEDTEYLKAKESALELIDASGLGELVKPGDAYISKDCIGDTRYPTNEEYYVFTFERIVGEGVIDYTFSVGGQTDEDYNKPFYHEKIEVWAYKDTGELVQFIWVSPTRVTEIINDNVKVQIDDKQAIELIKKQLYIQYASDEKEYNIEVEKIELTLARIKERDTDRYLIVPAWKCYGLVYEKRSEGGYRKLLGRSAVQETKEMVVINALDGSVIDMDRTY